MPSPGPRDLPVLPIEIDIFVRFHDKNPEKPRVSMLGYFDDQTEQVAGLELRLVQGVEYLMRFSIVDRSSNTFVHDSIRWTDLQNPKKFGDPPPALRSTSVSKDGKGLELHWRAGEDTPYVSMFTVQIDSPQGMLEQARIDPTIVNKPPE